MTHEHNRKLTDFVSAVMKYATPCRQKNGAVTRHTKEQL